MVSTLLPTYSERILGNPERIYAHSERIYPGDRDIMLPWEKGETHISVSLFIYEANMTVKEFYHSSAWSVTRDAYKRSVGGLCERCLRHGMISAGAEVHHKVRLTEENVNDPRISLSWENLELLCESCHDAEHSSKRFTVDALGRVISRETYASDV